MSAEIVNLRGARKKKARAEKEQRASANRAKHGQSKAQRNNIAANEQLRLSKLDDIIRERPNASEDC